MLISINKHYAITIFIIFLYFSIPTLAEGNYITLTGGGKIYYEEKGKGEPLTLFKQVAILLAYKLDVFEKTPKKEIRAKAAELIELIEDQYPEYVKEINQAGDTSDAIEKIFTKTMLEFKQ